jgi:hypothetical protein
MLHMLSLCWFQIPWIEKKVGRNLNLERRFNRLVILVDKHVYQLLEMLFYEPTNVSMNKWAWPNLF